ncbi:hypothetical protein GXB85_11745, partial [Cellulomonas sp. APG4]|nr:hypothetical protein [Cellulomonas sp. APG4]
MIVPGYAPGDWYAVVSDGTVVLLPPETDATVLDQMWTSLREHTDLTDHLGVLTRERITSLPPFAMVSVVAGLVRVIVRGDVEVEVVGDRGSRVLTAPDVSTWSEAVVQGALAVTVRADSAADAPEASLAVLSAVVRASQVRVGLRADVGTAAGADAAAAPAPEAPGRGQSGRRAHAALEPDAEPSVSEASVGEASSTEPFSTEPSLPEPTTAGGEPATPAPAVDEHATGEQTDASPASVEPTPAATLPPPAPAPAPAPPAAAPAQPAPCPLYTSDVADHT